MAIKYNIYLSQHVNHLHHVSINSLELLPSLNYFFKSLLFTMIASVTNTTSTQSNTIHSIGSLKKKSINVETFIYKNLFLFQAEVSKSFHQSSEHTKAKLEVSFWTWLCHFRHKFDLSLVSFASFWIILLLHTIYCILILKRMLKLLEATLLFD